MTGTFSVQYTFTGPEGVKEAFNLKIDTETIERVHAPVVKPPSWAELSFEQCPHCPLSADAHPYCPVAVNLVVIVDSFKGLMSYEQIHLEVVVEDRHIAQETTVQKGISSLMGLLIATSGCPYTQFFKPMARFHLPLASQAETVFRATASYLLAQYFLHRDGMPVDYELTGLTGIYEDMQVVNVHVAKRLRSAIETDPAVNAIILLDVYSKSMPIVIEDSLEEIRPLFESFFEHLAGFQL